MRLQTCFHRTLEVLDVSSLPSRPSFFEDKDQGQDADHKLTFEANPSTPNVIVLGISEANDSRFITR